jgi:GTPase SAR1 family protein
MITADEAQTLANRYTLHYFETSAKTGVNVEDAFMQLAREVVESKIPEQIS